MVDASDVIRAAEDAAAACCKLLIERLCDADKADKELRDYYTIEQLERFTNRYGGRL